jgi:hypothetical protein
MNRPKIFLSHTTHDLRDHDLALRLGAGLEARGAAVWIAPESIPAGDRWQEHIVSGVMTECSHFLVILSAASVNAKWVLREIELATARQAIDPAFRILPLPVGDLPPFAHKDFLASLHKVPFHADFQAQLEAVAEGVGLKPAVPQRVRDFVAEKTRDFIGREYVFAAVDAFLREKPNGYFTVEGDPGAGKSAILARFVQNTGCITHFNSRAQGIVTAAPFLESVCAQIITRFGLPYASLPPGATRDGAFLASLLREAADALADGDRIVIAVDALDEVALEGHAGNILFLPPTLPDRVFFLLTRRQTPLPLTVHAPQQLLDLSDYEEESQRDVSAFIAARVRSGPRLTEWLKKRAMSAAEFVVALAAKSQGNFMYARYVLPDLETGLYADLDIASLPMGLEAYYEDHWRRMGMTARPLPRVRIRIVYVLGVARAPVSRRLIAHFANDAALPVDELAVQEVLDDWDQFLHEQKQNGETVYSVYHASFRDFLHRRETVQAAGVTIEAIHALFADNLWQQIF